jgi:hypothetical protein
MEINAIKCLQCGDVIYSRTTHDYRCCTCNSCAIDGGFEYTRIIGEPEKIEHTTVNVDIPGCETDKEIKKKLYDDWNQRIDMYGLIKTQK